MKTSILKTVGGCLTILTVGVASHGIAEAQEPQEGVAYLQVLQTDSVKVLFPVLEKPTITLDKTSVNIVSDSKTYSADIAEILDFSFLGLPESGVNTIFEKKEDMELRNGIIVVNGLKANSQVCLYSSDGILYGKYTAKDGTVTIDLSQMPTGIFVLSTGKATYKIRK